MAASSENVLEAIFVIPGVWMGTRNASRDMDLLGALDITAIINVSGFDDDPIDDVEIYNYALNDHDLMENEYDRAIAKVNTIVNNLKKVRDAGKNVLVHCKDCVNRAPLIVAYYMVRDLNYDPAVALQTVKDANEGRDLDERVVFKHEDGTKELRCKNVKTLTNQSFRKLIAKAKK